MRGEGSRKLAQANLEMAEEVGKYADDPLGYVMFAFPWDTDPELQLVQLPEPWASRYGSKWGPDKWTCEFLEKLGEAVRERGFDPAFPKSVAAVRTAVRSGHGIGKSALVGMLICWLLDTRPNCKGVVTANTGEQLSSKTWPQIKKWREKSVTASWWEVLDGNKTVRHVDKGDAWCCDGITWNKHKSEAFAGQHAASSSSFYVFDEASNVPDEIFEVSEGGLTDGEPFHFCFGNPTRNKGYFFERFHKFRLRMDITMEIDSREAQLTNKEQIAQWEEDYGEDSDFFRIRVRGVEPKTGDKQLIGYELIQKARFAEPAWNMTDPIIAGLDVARGGLDESVLAIRRGNDADSIRWSFWNERDSTRLAGFVANRLSELAKLDLNVSMTFVDGGNAGGPVCDILRKMGWPVTEVCFGGKPDDNRLYRDKAAEMWTEMRDWMLAGGAIPDDPILHKQMTDREYDLTGKAQMYLMPKDELDESPDRPDALGLTFAMKVAPSLLSGLPQAMAGHVETLQSVLPS